MEVLEPGHVYELRHLESEGHETLTFVRRSSEAVYYGERTLLSRALAWIGSILVRLGHWLSSFGDGEHPGTNTQEVLRALIDRTEFLHDVLPSVETKDAAWYLRMALFCYEVRAWRRKQAKQNKTAQVNDYEERYEDAPFNEQGIEDRPVGPDGHIILEALNPEVKDETSSQV